jgi:DNA-binding NarL/FixJ family response regulator
LVDVIPVVVVDDDAAFRAAAAALLGVADGFVVAAQADSWEAASGLLTDEVRVLVLMDINMPGVDGIAAAEIIRHDRPDVPVVLMSTYDPADLPAAALACGACAYIRKEQLDPALLRQAWNQQPVQRP